jgi:hypothetical protein
MHRAVAKDEPRAGGPLQRASAAYPSKRALALGIAYALFVGGAMRFLDVVLCLARPRLLVAYARLWRTAFRTSPYRERSYAKIAAAKRARLGLDELTYGETPLCTAVAFGARAGIGRSSVVVDPLAGRGRFLLAARWLGARARGVELVEENHWYAAPILAHVGVDVAHDDAALADYADATHVFLCWTCCTPETRAAIGRRITDTLRPGARVLTVTWPLDDDAAYTTAWTRRYLFSWGRGDVTLQTRR